MLNSEEASLSSPHGQWKKAQIQTHARAIATLLYEETDPEQVKMVAGIEATVPGHLLEHDRLRGDVPLDAEILGERLLWPLAIGVEAIISVEKCKHYERIEL